MLSRISKLLFSLVFITLPFQLAYHFWPSYAILHNRQIDLLSPAIYLSDIFTIIYLITRYANLKIIVLNTKSYRFLAPILLVLINLAFSLSPLNTTLWLLKIMVFSLFALDIYYHRRQLCVIIAKPLFISTSLVCFLAWLQFFAQSSLGGLWWFVGERPLSLAMPGIAKVSLASLGLFLRPYATFPHPNALAGFLLVVYLLSQKLFPKSLLLFKFLLTLTMFITFSRTAIFTFLFIELIRHRDHKYILLWALLLIVPFFIPGNPDSLSERNILITQAVEILHSRPLTGAGFGNYLLALPTIILIPVHNLYLLLLVELGILPVIYLAMLAKRLKINLILIAIFITSLMDHYWLTSHQNLLLIFTILPLYL